jgi:hypothetical protein
MSVPAKFSAEKEQPSKPLYPRLTGSCTVASRSVYDGAQSADKRGRNERCDRDSTLNDSKSKTKMSATLNASVRLEHREIATSPRAPGAEEEVVLPYKHGKFCIETVRLASVLSVPGSSSYLVVGRTPAGASSETRVIEVRLEERSLPSIYPMERVGNGHGRRLQLVGYFKLRSCNRVSAEVQKGTATADSCPPLLLAPTHRHLAPSLAGRNLLTSNRVLHKQYLQSWPILLLTVPASFSSCSQAPQQG